MQLSFDKRGSGSIWPNAMLKSAIAQKLEVANVVVSTTGDYAIPSSDK